MIANVKATPTGRHQVINPATGLAHSSVPDMSVADVTATIEACARAFADGWSTSAPSLRSTLLRKLADALRSDRDRLAALESRSNGKPITQTRGEVLKAASIFDHAAGLTSTINGETIPLGDGRHAYTFLEPVGVVAGIVPWNSPLIIAAMAAAPALAAGCTVVLKPSPIAPLEVFELEDLARQAGFPTDVLRVVTGASDEIGQTLVDHPTVATVVFTGSTAVGAMIAESAGRGIKRVLLELGGKSPVGVFPDADLRAAARGVAQGITLSGAQSCVTPSRLLIEESIVDEFVEMLCEEVRNVVIGDPMDEKTTMGPMSSASHAQRVRDFYDEAIAAGGEATICYPEVLPEGDAFVPVAIVRVPSTDVRLWREEVFGPVLSWTTFTGEEDYLRIANDTDFGLGAVIWTRDASRALRIAKRSEVGIVWVNSQRKTAPEVPFGGAKRSGFGRENGSHAAHEFLRTKTVYLEGL